MKLVLFCLFAVCCWYAAAFPRPDKWKPKLEEILRQLQSVRESMQNPDMKLSSPPAIITNSGDALKCFRDSLKNVTEVDENVLKKLDKNLNKTLTSNALNISDSDDAMTTCSGCTCESEVTLAEFLDRLQTFIQKRLSELTMS